MGNRLLGSISMNAVLALAIALVASLAGNGLLAWAYLGQRDAASMAREQTTAAHSERDEARVLAHACSDTVDDLRELAERRKREAEGVRRQMEAKARNHDSRADAVLAAAPTVPGDSCASAQVLVQDWLKARAAP